MDEQPFLDAICAAPDDETQRLIYADWLEERGDRRGEYLRLEVEFRKVPLAARAEWPHRVRLLLLHLTISSDWIRRVARGRIRGCEPRDRPSCPRAWQRLSFDDAATGLRRCSICDHHVHYCRTGADCDEHHGSPHVVDLARLIWGDVHGDA